MEKVKLTQSVSQPMPKAGVQQMAQPMQMQKPMTMPMPMSNPAVQMAENKVTKSLCESHMHRYVEIQAADGYCYDGIVEHVDDEWICIAVPGAVDQMRGLFPHPPLYPPPGPYYPFRPRRFNRLVLPLAGLAALTLLPYYW